MIKIKKNDIITLDITDITGEGNGVGKFEGMAVFVPETAAGDRIKCRIVKVLKSYCFGIAEEIITPSESRFDRGCQVKKTCGGCIFRHISYESEKKIKQDMVKNAFTRLGKFSEDSFEMPDIMGCAETDRYRNKAQYPVAADKDGKAVCGFFAKRSHRIIPCTDCLLQPEIFSDILNFIMEYVNSRKLSPYNETEHTGILRHIYLRRGHHSGEIMICFVVRKKADRELYPLAEKLMKKYPDVKSVIMNINPVRTNVIMGEKSITLAGCDTIKDIMCGNEITLSPHSFYQVNTPQAEKLYGKAKEFASLSGCEDVLDLYCGAGTIGISLADCAKHITGAEIVAQAVENAKQNARRNNIRNADFICADAGQAAKILADEGRKPDVIITDPPRKGCDELTLDSIIKMSPKRIVMVSCNPATAARDCRYLANEGYILKKVQAVDLFPAAGHVECVILMEKQ